MIPLTENADALPCLKASRHSLVRNLTPRLGYPNNDVDPYV